MCIEGTYIQSPAAQKPSSHSFTITLKREKSVWLQNLPLIILRPPNGRQRYHKIPFISDLFQLPIFNSAVFFPAFAPHPPSFLLAFGCFFFLLLLPHSLSTFASLFFLFFRLHCYCNVCPVHIYFYSSTDDLVAVFRVHKIIFTRVLREPAIQLWLIVTVVHISF